jgi:uncharacterized membrane protein YfcA
MGLIPVVASATSMYTVLYSTFSASLLVVVFGKLNLSYALNISVLTIFATPLGIYLQRLIVERTKR